MGCEPAGVSGAFRDRQSAGYSEDTEALWAAVSDGNAVLNFRSSILPEISEAHEDEPELKDFLIHAGQLNLLKENYSDLVEFTGLSIKAGLPQPGLQAALNYINSLKTEYLSTNMVQAQRDYFGQHGFERIDRQGTFHSDWK